MSITRIEESCFEITARSLAPMSRTMNRSGEELEVAGRIREGKNGGKFISLSVR